VISRRKLPRSGWHLLLALVLLLMQQAGLRHSLQHLTHDEDSAPTHAACLLCVAHHGQDHTLSGTPPLVAPLSLAGHVFHATAALPPYLGGLRLNYRSRAPPLAVSA
jgi:hypothetical protein